MVTPFSPLQAGGVQRYVWELSTHLLSQGVHVEVLCSDPSARHGHSQRHGELVVHTVRAWPRGRDWCFAPGIWRQLSVQPWDVIHVQSYHTLVAPLSMLRALNLRVPYCVTFHGGGSTSDLRTRARPVQRRLLGPLLTRASGLVAVARFEADLFSAPLGIPRERIRVIPVGTDLVVQDAPAATNGGSTLGSIGRLERYKGHHRVIEALPELLRARPDARLLVVGQGPYDSELRDCAARHGVQDKVQFTSVPPGDTRAMSELLSRLSLVVLMSEFETYPQVAIEAAAARRPLLVGDDGAGLREMAEDGLARMVPLDASPQGLARAIAEALEQPPSGRPPRLMSWDDCAAEMTSLYREVVAGERDV